MSNWIQFTAINERNEMVGQSDWVEEHTSRDAPALLTRFRQQVGDSHKYIIQRKGDSRIPNQPKVYRYRIAEGDSVYYSRLVQEGEKDERLAEIQQQFPKAKITEEQA